MKILNIALFLLTLRRKLEVNGEDVWAWRCAGPSQDRLRCVKERKIESGLEAVGQMTFNACKLTCMHFGALMPKPKYAYLGDKTVPFLPSNISLDLDDCTDNVCPLLQQAFFLFEKTIHNYHPSYSRDYAATNWLNREFNAKYQNVVIEMDVEGSEEYLSFDTNESYTLKIETEDDGIKVCINASTFFGARHALETLSQLIDYDEENDSLQIVSSVEIEDSPAFPYRGLLLDTSRNFISVDKIKRVLDGMAYNKLNTFHWHITDSQSFPLNIRSMPNMSLFGAYSQSQVYDSKDVKELVSYARLRGIRVIPELDAPAHVGHGWEWAEENGLGNLVVCLDKEPWNQFCSEPPCGQLNIANENIYGVLRNIYEEMLDIFHPLTAFHYGGDEINFNCWNTTKEVTEWMTEKNVTLDEKSFMEQWGVFQQKAIELFTNSNAGKKIPGILWTSKLTEKGNLDMYLNKTDYVIQIWTDGNDPKVKDILNKDYRVIFSNHDALYLDCGVSSWYAKGPNWCSPYKGWQDIYDNDILTMATEAKEGPLNDGQVLGAEAALWTEQADDETIEMKLWPRGSALAERLWSNPENNYEEADTRMVLQRHRMVTRGLQATRLQPEWCRYNQEKCHLPN